MILDPADDPLDGHLEPGDDPADDDDDEVGEWQAGLRRLGFAARPRAATLQLSPAAAALARPDAAPAARTPSADTVALYRRAWADSTVAAYQADWRRYSLWCDVAGIDEPLAAGALTVANYVAALTAQRLTPATIRRRLAAIAWAHEIANLPSPTADPLVRRVVAGAERSLGTTPDQAVPLSLVNLRDLLVRLPILRANHPAMRRDQLLVGLGWAGALRPGELVALDADHLRFHGDPNTDAGGLLVTVARSKTDPAAAGDVVAIPYATRQLACPARHALRYLREHRNGPLFRHIDRHGRPRRRLTAAAVAPLLRRLIADILHVDPASYAAASLRAGLATEARSHGVDDARIRRHLRHTAPGQRRHAGTTLDIYDRPGNLLARSALAGEWW